MFFFQGGWPPWSALSSALCRSWHQASVNFGSGGQRRLPGQLWLQCVHSRGHSILKLEAADWLPGLRRLVPPAGPQRLREGGSAEAYNAVWHREGSRGEEWSISSVPRGRGLSPHQAPTLPEKRVADNLPRRWPQMWPRPHWSLGTLGLNGDDEHYDGFLALCVLWFTTDSCSLAQQESLMWRKKSSFRDIFKKKSMMYDCVWLMYECILR